jgi:hypothetical protein
VVGGEDHRNRARNGRIEAALNGAHLCGERFESTERTLRLRKDVQATAGSLPESLIYRRDGGKTKRGS